MMKKAWQQIRRAAIAISVKEVEFSNVHRIVINGLWKIIDKEEDSLKTPFK